MELCSVNMEQVGGFCDKAYLNEDSSQLLWAVEFFQNHEMLQQNHKTARQRRKFVSEFQKQVRMLRDDFGLEEQDPPQDQKMASTSSMVMYLFHISSDPRFCGNNQIRTQKVQDFLNTLVQKVQCELEVLPDNNRMTVRDIQIAFSNRGQVYFGDWVKATSAPQALGWIKKTWKEMRDNWNVGLGIIENDACHIRDLMIFFLSYKLIRKGKLTETDKKFFVGLFVWLVGFLSKHLDAAFLRAARPRLEADFVPPARGTPGGHVKVDPLAVWQLVEDAQSRKRSLLEVLNIRLLDADREQFNSRYKDCSVSQVPGWQNAYLTAYIDRMKTLLRPAVQFSVVTDASTHSNKEMLASLCYANDHAVMVPITVCKQGDIDMNDVNTSALTILKEIAKKTKLERQSAWHFIRAMFHQLSVITDGRVNIASFKIERIDARRPVKAGEERIRRTQEGILPVIGLSDIDETHIHVKEHTAYIQKQDGSTEPVLPTDRGWHNMQPMLTLSIDQGGVGMAALAFLLPTHMLHVRCDKIHRVVRDYKLAIGHAADGLFLKTQLHSGYIFSINYKPFNKGNFFEQKKVMVEEFLAAKPLVDGFNQSFGIVSVIATNNNHNLFFWFDMDIQPRRPTDELFLEFAPHIAADLEIDWDRTTPDFLWNAAFESAESFRKKGSMVKMSRWFSWNQCAEEQLRDWHTFKMVLTYNSKSKGLVPNDGEEQANESTDREKLMREAKCKKNNETKNWQLLKQTAGAFPLAFKIMTPQLHRHVKMLQMATRPMWSWYTRQVTEIKTTSQTIDYAISMVLPLEHEAGWTWMKEVHLCELAHVLCHDEVSQFEREDDPLAAEKLFELILQLLSRRAWSLAVRHSLPPEQFAGVLSPESDLRKASMELLKICHEGLLKWEHDVVNDTDLKSKPTAQLLKDDVSFAVNHPSRLMMDAFESIDYEHRRLRPGGYKTTNMGKEPGEHLLETLLAPSTMQSICMNCGVLESRGIPHQAAVAKEEFLESLKKNQRVATATSLTAKATLCQMNMFKFATRDPGMCFQRRHSKGLRQPGPGYNSAILIINFGKPQQECSAKWPLGALSFSHRT